MVYIENKDKGLQDKEEKLDHSLQVNADILTNGAEHKKDLGVHKITIGIIHIEEKEYHIEKELPVSYFN